MGCPCPGAHSKSRYDGYRIVDVSRAGTTSRFRESRLGEGKLESGTRVDKMHHGQDSTAGMKIPWSGLCLYMP